jgi:ATP-dependent helicase/nuclease subunit A
MLAESVADILKPFVRSDAYATLAGATILGREVPFMMPWGDGQVLEGVIDVIYRSGDRVWITDYKTDAVTAEEAPVRAERYRTQTSLYAGAAAQSLGLPSVSARIIFLRPAVAVDL